MAKFKELSTQPDLISISDFNDLINNAESGAFELFVEAEPTLSVNVKIITTKLTDADIPTIQRLFNYFFQNKQNYEFILILGEHKTKVVSLDVCKKITQINMNKELAKKGGDELLRRFKHYPLFTDYRITIGFLSALSQNNISITPKELAEALEDEIKWHGQYNDLLIHDFTICFLFLCQYADNKKLNQDVVSIALPELVKLFITKNNFTEIHHLTEEPYLSALRNLNEIHSFLHFAIKKANHNGFRLLGKLLYHDAKQPIRKYDIDDRNFLFFANDIKTLELAYEYTPDVNSQDKFGDTALMATALSGDLNKAVFLLQHGANPEIKNKNQKDFWSVDIGNEHNSLKEYRMFKFNGNVLKLPLELMRRKSQDCGFYAVAYSVAHHRADKPELFNSPTIPARKADTNPKSTQSLRQMRNELGIPGHGPIFSVNSMQKLIEKSGCSSMVYDIDNFKQFFSLIQIAIANNLPIIIPFATQNNSFPLVEGSSERSHWATIIGWGDDQSKKGILIASHGKFLGTSAEALFDSFFNMEQVFKKAYLYKVEGKNWRRLLTEEPPANARISEIPETDLTEFRRKLVVVLPPQCPPQIITSLDQEYSKKYSADSTKKKV